MVTIRIGSYSRHLERECDLPIKLVDLYTQRIGKGQRKAQRGQRWSGPQGFKRYHK